MVFSHQRPVLFCVKQSGITKQQPEEGSVRLTHTRLSHLTPWSADRVFIQDRLCEQEVSTEIRIEFKIENKIWPVPLRWIAVFYLLPENLIKRQKAVFFYFFSSSLKFDLIFCLVQSAQCRQASIKYRFGKYRFAVLLRKQPRPASRGWEKLLQHHHWWLERPWVSSSRAFVPSR